MARHDEPDPKPDPKPAPKHASKAAPAADPAALRAEIVALEEKIADDKATLQELLFKLNAQEFPKHVTVNGETKEFQSRAEQDAAGPAWADKT